MAAKSYSKFKTKDIQQLGIGIEQDMLFKNIELVAPSTWLTQTIAFNMAFPRTSEKAKSEFFVTPILTEIATKNKKKITYYSGYSLSVDPKKGLNGVVDYIISKTPFALEVEAPIVCIAEAKNDNFDMGIPQCIAEMYAARLWNETEGKATPFVYGIVTSGLNWRFLRLEDSTCKIDSDIYYLDNLPKLLGVLQHIVDVF